MPTIWNIAGAIRKREWFDEMFANWDGPTPARLKRLSATRIACRLDIFIIHLQKKKSLSVSRFLLGFRSCVWKLHLKNEETYGSIWKHRLTKAKKMHTKNKERNQFKQYLYTRIVTYLCNSIHIMFTIIYGVREKTHQCIILSGRMQSVCHSMSLLVVKAKLFTKTQLFSLEQLSARFHPEQKYIYIYILYIIAQSYIDPVSLE